MRAVRHLRADLRRDHGPAGADFAYRGSRTRISTFGRNRWSSRVCESCGECVVRCPVGACCRRNSSRPAGSENGLPLLRRRLRHRPGRPRQPRRQRPRRREPGQPGKLCVKGRFGYDFVHHPDRLTTPLINDPAGRSRFPGFREASWDEALRLAAERLTSIRRSALRPSWAFPPAAAPTRKAIFSRSSCGRVVGTNNVDNFARAVIAPRSPG